MAHAWTTFWTNQRKDFHAIMRLATGYFGRQLVSRGYIAAGTRVLDFGCGPGFLADEILRAGVDLTGVDINSEYISECKQKHPHTRFFLVEPWMGDDRSLSAALRHEQYNLIIVLSIVQYFRSLEDVGSLLSCLKRHLKDGGVVIVADVIDPAGSKRADAIALLFHCLRSGRVGAFVRFVFYVLTSDYKTASKATTMLEISPGIFEDTARAAGFECEHVRGLTIHPGRNNFILRPR